jgi:hypothetical protein
METLSLVTYGKGTFFDKNKFQFIKNAPHWNKPSGGLWASPINSKYGWKDWCIIEEFGNLSSSFEFTITGNIFKIENIDDLNQLPLIVNDEIYYKSPSFYNTFIDFEAVVNSGIDAIWLTESAIRYKEFYGWDCESVLILNPSCIQISNM